MSNTDDIARQVITNELVRLRDHKRNTYEKFKLYYKIPANDFTFERYCEYISEISREQGRLYATLDVLKALPIPEVNHHGTD